MKSKYRLKKDYESPTQKVYAGVVKTAGEWKKEYFFDMFLEDFDIKTDWFEKVEEEHPVFGSKPAALWCMELVDRRFKIPEMTLIERYGKTREGEITVENKTEAFHIADEYAKAINGDWEPDFLYQGIDNKKWYVKACFEELGVEYTKNTSIGVPVFKTEEYAEQAIKDIPEVFKILLDAE